MPTSHLRRMASPSSKASSLLKDAFGLIVTFSSLVCLSTAQQQSDGTLVGCTSIPGCSSNTGCTVGNATNVFLGATAFNATFPTSSLSSPESESVELTWTVGALSSTASSTSNTLFTKNFYLGYPPTLDLSGTSAFAGCALFFEGIARSISLNNSEFGSMTCGAALGEGCATDLLDQAETQIQTLLKAEDACAKLQDILERNPPQSCRGLATVTWGSIVAKDLTGANAPLSPPLQSSSCHPTLGGEDYNVALIETQTVRSEEVSSDHTPFFYSITPVVSVFYDASSSTSASSNANANINTKAYMSCLKVVDDGASGSSGGGGAGSLSTQSSNGAAPLTYMSSRSNLLAWVLTCMSLTVVSFSA
ncbi:hypothetical protein PV08_08439 [Exophiala spinifera]|uniref:Uncharacterized protein n=1 Tax=Exophiala spinifera TaxID=91928 RepID=A0A0D1ZK92_9EURO|nr:uncharacterized protein PV08_08439 [Exophiala spinifera]KIW13252.1 hypothetical protein PV08_08439 [Exophiala spinifera]